MADLSKLGVEAVPKAHEPRFQHLLEAHHSLGVAPKIGETRWYVASLDPQWVARASFSAAALKCRARGSAGTWAANTVTCRAFSTIRGFCCDARSQMWDHGCCRCWKKPRLAAM